RADRRQWYDGADVEVPRTAHDLHRLIAAGIHDDAPDLVGAFDGTDLYDLGDDDAGEIVADGDHLIDRHTEISQHRGEFVERQLDRHELTQPRENDLHRRTFTLPFDKAAPDSRPA